jgi:hypothetical protein
MRSAWETDNDSMVLKNYISPGGKRGDVLVVRDPAQLRDLKARFHPANATARIC